MTKQPDLARLALNCIITAYHLHEWVWGDWLKTDHATWRKLNIRDKESFLQWLFRAFPYFGYVEALANGSKHFSRNQEFATKRILQDEDGPFLVGMPYRLIDFGEMLDRSDGWQLRTSSTPLSDFGVISLPGFTLTERRSPPSAELNRRIPKRCRKRTAPRYRVSRCDLEGPIANALCRGARFVLPLATALNQIGVFMKLVRFSSNKDPLNPTEQLVSAGQTQK